MTFKNVQLPGNQVGMLVQSYNILIYIQRKNYSANHGMQPLFRICPSLVQIGDLHPDPCRIITTTPDIHGKSRGTCLCAGTYHMTVCTQTPPCHWMWLVWLLKPHIMHPNKWQLIAVGWTKTSCKHFVIIIIIGNNVIVVDLLLL